MLENSHIKFDFGDRVIFKDGCVILRDAGLKKLLLQGKTLEGITAFESDLVTKFNRYSHYKINTNNSTFDPKWITPEPYCSLDLTDKCIEQLHLLNLWNEPYQVRVSEELAFIEEHKLENFIRAVFWICTIMDQHNLIRGVGRGSSCASLVLYLLDIHCVDPVKYDIPYTEFFRVKNK